jgi:3-methyladenine DNA glycosylase AlkC
MTEPVKLKEYFDSNLAALLAEKIVQLEPHFVKKSVANNMNDILKDNPDLAMPVLPRWAGLRNPHTNWIIKRGG